MPTSPTDPQIIVTHRDSIFRHFHFLIPASLLLIPIILGPYLARYILRLRPSPTPTPTQAPVLIPSTPAPTPKPIVQNKLYHNLDLEFSFEYPENLFLVECGGAVYLFDVNTPSSSDNFCNNLEGTVISIKTAPSSFYLPLEEDSSIKIEEQAISIAGVDAIERKIEDINTKDYKIYVTFSKDGKTHFQVALISKLYQQEFDKLVKSFDFTGDLTVNWQSYLSAEYGFSLKYPPDWRLSEPRSGSVEIRKTENSDLASLIIDASKNLSNANLTASEIISSTKTLSGWLKPPSVEIRNLGKGTAQILQGQFSGSWRVFVAIWYKNRLVQVIWNDSPDQPDTKNFDLILSSFTFTN